MKKLIYPIFSLLMLFGATGCEDDFFDINKNPNAPTEESITPQLILPRALHATAARMATSVDYAAHWTGYWARSGTYGPSTEQESYNITNNYQAGQWTGWYDVLYDVELMERKAKVADQDFYIATAKTLKSIGFMYLVDQYGNVPYSKAFDFEGNMLPTYDKGEDIYDSLLVELDEAAQLFKAAEVTPAMKTVDIMFAGNTTKWRKLVNSQRLKLIIRQSEVSGFNAAAEIAKIEADGAGFIGKGETAYVQPGYAVVAGQQNPFWNAYKADVTGSVADNYNRANNYVLDKLSDNGDIRYQYYFSKARTPIGGVQYYGYNFGEVIPNDDPKAANSSDVAGPGLAKSATQPQWLFTSVESMFLQAEAAQRGWLTGVEPKAAFQAAVTESFNWLGVEITVAGVTKNATTVANEYLAQTDTDGSLIDIVDYDAATDKVRFIVMHKYLSLVGINNFEAWVDYRRLGVPTDLPLSLSPSRGGNAIPKRLLYPANEYSYNASNVAKEGAISAQTTKVFWDVN